MTTWTEERYREAGIERLCLRIPKQTKTDLLALAKRRKVSVGRLIAQLMEGAQ